MFFQHLVVDDYPNGVTNCQNNIDFPGDQNRTLPDPGYNECVVVQACE